MRNKRKIISKEQMLLLCAKRGVNIKNYVTQPNGKYRVRMTSQEYSVVFNKDPEKMKPEVAVEESTELDELKSLYTPEEIGILIENKKNPRNFELIDFGSPNDPDRESNVGILLFSDWHADEVVKPETVLFKNEYNSEVAKQRITTLFQNAVKVVRRKPVDELIIGSLGDLIGGYIHEELQQTNSMTPMQGISMVKSLMVSGLKYLTESLNIKKVTFVGICGNHSRTTRRMQFSNGYALSYEYFMYKDIEETCKLMGMDIQFIIPQSEFAYIKILNHDLLFCHGHQFKYAGGIGGIYPSMLRWFSKMSQIVHIDKAFIGHWHTTINIKEICVNGTVKGQDAYAMGKGIAAEEPQQTYIILNSKRGFIFHTPVFCS